jgi:predicted naringenin-chalcone synthase
MPYIAGCAVEPCPHLYTQEELRAAAREVFAAAPELERHLAVFDTVGIRRRRFAAPLERLLVPDGWIERSPIFIREGTRLAAC